MTWRNVDSPTRRRRDLKLRRGEDTSLREHHICKYTNVITRIVEIGVTARRLHVEVSTSEVPLTLPANSSGSTITYRVVAKVRDKYYGTNLYDWEFMAVESSPGGQPPTAAALRAGGDSVVDLGTVTVTNGLSTITTSNIFEDSREVAAAGGAWTNITTFYNNWTSFVGTYRPVGFRLDGDGTVHLDGLLKAAASGTDSGADAFLIPVGFRPHYTQVFNTFSQRSNVRELARLDVRTSGTVAVWSPSGDDWRLATSDYISLSNITYSIVP